MRRRHGDTLPAPEAATDLPRKAPTDLRARLDNLPAGHASGTDYQPPTWEQAKARFAEAWRQHEKNWPRAEHRPESAELSTAVERELADGCDKIQAAADDITGRLRTVEGSSPAGL